MHYGKVIAREVLEKGWSALDPAKVGFFHASFFAGSDPVLTMLCSLRRGAGFVIVNEFLEKVGVGNTFQTTYMTGQGKAFISKLEDRGFVESVPENLDNGFPFRFRVARDPRQSLIEFAEQGAVLPMRRLQHPSSKCIP
jgi:hypothetical protein